MHNRQNRYRRYCRYIENRVTGYLSPAMWADMRLLSLTLVVLLVCSSASAQFGPPQTRAPGQGYSLGVGLHNVMSEWTYDFEIARNRIYFEGSLGLSDWSE